MKLRTLTTTMITAGFAAIIATHSFAGGSGQHSAQSTNHSGQASVHGSAAVVTTAATVLAVPVIAVGGSFAITGAALESVGTGAMEVGVEMIPVEQVQTKPRHIVTPDGKPTLD